MREEISYRFTQAIVRTPCNNVAHALRAADRGAPNAAAFMAEHQVYVATLQSLDLEVTVLPELDEFPDSVFIEDTALCLPEGAIILRPGTASRLDEARHSAAALDHLGMELNEIDASGTVDGGDVLITGSIVFVGLSARTNQAGFESLSKILGSWGYEARAVATPVDVLHFKSDCNILDDNTLLCTSRLAGDPQIQDFRILTVPSGEEAAANSIRVNDSVLMPQGFPGTAQLLENAGFDVIQLSASQAALADGGLSCMSLRLV